MSTALSHHQAAHSESAIRDDVPAWRPAWQNRTLSTSEGRVARGQVWARSRPRSRPHLVSLAPSGLALCRVQLNSVFQAASGLQKN